MYQLAIFFGLLCYANRLPIFGLPADVSAWTRTDELVHTTLIFNAFIWSQIFNQINARKLEDGKQTLRAFIFYCWVY